MSLTTEERDEFIINKLKANFTRKELAEICKLPYHTITYIARKYERETGEDLPHDRKSSGPKPRDASTDPRTQHIIDLYQNHNLTLEAIGKRLSPPITRERVRQIIVRWERTTSQKIQRKRFSRNPQRVPRIAWVCPSCGEERFLFKSQRPPKLCFKCRCDQQAHPNAQDMYLLRKNKYLSWTQIAAQYHMAPNAAARIVFFYLKRVGRIEEVPELFGKTHWLKKYGYEP